MVALGQYRQCLSLSRIIVLQNCTYTSALTPLPCPITRPQETRLTQSLVLRDNTNKCEIEKKKCNCFRSDFICSAGLFHKWSGLDNGTNFTATSFIQCLIRVYYCSGSNHAGYPTSCLKPSFSFSWTF